MCTIGAWLFKTLENVSSTLGIYLGGKYCGPPDKNFQSICTSGSHNYYLRRMIRHRNGNRKTSKFILQFSIV